MNTAELVDEVAAQTGMAKDGVRKVLDAVLGAVAEAAKAGQASPPRASWRLPLPSHYGTG